MKISKLAIKEIGSFIKTHFGEEGYTKWLKSISPEAKKVYTSKNYKQWYELKNIFLDPVQVMCDLFYDGDFFGAEEIGIYGAENSLNSFLKFFIKLGSPEFMIRRGKDLFSKYYKNDATDITVEIIKLKKGKGTIRIHNFGKMEKINEHILIGWMIKALELCRTKNITINCEQKIINNKNVIDFNSTWE